MKKFVNLLPTNIGHYGLTEFNAGMVELGYTATTQYKMQTPSVDDVLIVWNRQSVTEHVSKRFEAANAKIVVVENGYFGKQWLGSQWFALALGHHNGAGTWPVGDGSRWAALGVPLAPWRDPGGEIVVLGQRGIGEVGLRSPSDWHRLVGSRLGLKVRIRQHPGREANRVLPIERDLAGASAVCTWASSAALRALQLGIPVFYECKSWIGRTAARPIKDFRLGPVTNDAQRLSMFERLAWAMCRREEVATGEALDRLLLSSPK